MSIPETRFKDKSGEQFLTDGRIRCHGLAKSRIRKWREEFEDDTTPTPELWPECQCKAAAVTNQFVCKWHGGKTPRTKNPSRTMLDVMPLEMAETYKAIMDSPDYISRKDDINLIKTRVVMLLAELDQEAGSDEAWGLVHEARVKLKQGDSPNALDYMNRAIKATENKKSIWNELYKTEKLLGDLTTTQMKTAKELQSMATAEQVSGLITTLINMVLSGAQEYINDPMQRTEFTNTIVSRVYQLTGTTPKQVIDAG